MGTSETLRAVIDAGRTAKRLDELSSARVICKIAEQIHQAHQRAGTGKPIGPITPAGIAIDSKGVPKLGLAEPTAYAYCSPEQAGGEQGDRRSDVFSLGIIMWEMLTHQTLFEAGSEAATKAAVAERSIVAPSELNANVPAELGAICMKALARDASDRYHTAKIMAAEIEAVLDDAGYGNSDEKIAAYVGSLEKTAAATSKRPGPSAAPTGKLPSSVATATLPPPRRSGLTSSPLTVAPSPTLPSVLGRPRVGPSTPIPATVPDVRAVPAVPAVPSVPSVPAVPSPATKTPLPATVPDAPAVAAPMANTPVPTTIPDSPAVPTTAPGFAGAPGMTPVPTDAQPGGPASTPVATLVGSLPGPAPAPLPPSPDPASSSNIPFATTAVHVVPPSSAQAAKPEPVAPNEARGAAPLPTSGARSPTAPPHAAGAVTLSSKARETELLDGWSWKTGAHPQVEEQDDLSDDPRARSPILYIIGGGIALASVIVVVAFAMGGGKKPEKQVDPAQTAATDKSRDPHSVNAKAAPPADAALPSSDAATAAGSANGPVDESSQPGAESGKDAGVIDSAVATQAASPPEEPSSPTTSSTPKGSTSNTKVTATPVKPDRTVKPPTKPNVKPNTKPNPTSSSSRKKNAELPYRQGLQLFMRGDTSGALTALRSSIAANSSYAPAWRALGLVYEKMGDKDQARRSLRRYLQLAPRANDAEQIRNRLKRLGP